VPLRSLFPPEETAMWHTNTLWFEIAIVMAIFAFGNILFGHFEAHKPKWQRVLKIVNVTVIFVVLSVFLGRAWAFGFLALLLLGAAIIHLWWLPRNGVNGWTAEPRERYYELIKVRK
jgi:hypothetical protein